MSKPAVIVPRELLEEMTKLIIDLYPGHITIPLAQGILDKKMSDHYTLNNVKCIPFRQSVVDLPGTIDIHVDPSEPTPTAAERWHAVILAKLQRDVTHMERAVKYFERPRQELIGILTVPVDVPCPLFTIKSLYWIFESTDGHWEEIWERCFGIPLCW